MTLRAAAVLSAGSLVALSALTGCGGGPAPAPDGRPSVVTTTDVYAAVATAVAGDKASVSALITSPDADPHEYESTPTDAVKVSAATVFIDNGGGYDDFAGRLVETAGDGTQRPVVLNASELSGLPSGPGFNEHVWYHLPTVAALADRLAAELGKADPPDAPAFTANARAFTADLDGLRARLTRIAGEHRGQRVAVTEPVPGYLVEAAGLVNATPPEFTEATESGNDPPAAVLEATLALLRGPDPVRALLLNPQAENAATRQLADAARAAGVPVVTVTETLPADTGDYLTWMGAQIDALAAALDRR
jgi:zinc/manganese transport system substrate-binding protein